MIRDIQFDWLSWEIDLDLAYLEVSRYHNCIMNNNMYACIHNTVIWVSRFLLSLVIGLLLSLG